MLPSLVTVTEIVKGRVSDFGNGNARFAIEFGLCQNVIHTWKMQLKIQLAIPFENCPEYSSILGGHTAYACKYGTN